MASYLLILCLAPLQPVLHFCDAETWSTQHHIEVQTIDTSSWVTFDPQIDVFLDPKAKVSSI